MAEEIDDTLELGGNIELSGFSKVDRSNMVIVKKIVGSYAKKLYEHGTNTEKISVHLKGVHHDQGPGKFEMHVKVLIEGKPVTSECVNNNLFFALDEALKKIENQISK
jgi:ribosome-associated translation inhibitor RaiA